MIARLLITVSLALGVASANATAGPIVIRPGTMPGIARVDARFLSYNIEMAAVVGASFWKPYGTGHSSPGTAAGGKSLRAHLAARPPIDLGNPLLRRLAAALGPAYLRVSGTWANSVYFADTDRPPAKPPQGFRSVLTRREWRGVVSFTKATDARLVTSFAISPGTRDEAGVWTPNQAASLVQFTRGIGGGIAAAALMNEPNFPATGGAPKGYDAADFARDFAVFRRFARTAAPAMKILGPSATGDALAATGMQLPAFIATSKLLSAEPRPRFDAFSYHFYGAIAQRCVPPGTPVSTTAAAALGDEWLDRTEAAYRFYARLRDQYDPGAPIWLTESADAGCGGNPWAKTFLDSFRYLNQLGALSALGVAVVMHNTLVGSDYGLLDEDSYRPRPNYWAALLWRRLMGRVVLDPSMPRQADLRVYAHCLGGHSGGVALLLLNTSKSEVRRVAIGSPMRIYALSAKTLESGDVQLNGRLLALEPGGRLPALSGRARAAGTLSLAPGTITFVTVNHARNAACKRDSAASQPL